MSFKDFLIYGAGIAGACMLVYGAGCSLSDWLRDRREDMKMARAIRLGRMAHEEHSYSIAPEAPCLESEEFEDFFDLVDLSADPGYIQTGIDCAWIYAIDPEAREKWDQEQAA